MNNAKIIVSKTDYIIQAGIKKVLSGGGVQKFRFFFALVDIFYRKERGSMPIFLAGHHRGVLLFG